MRVGLIARTLIGIALAALLVGGLLIALILTVGNQQDATREAKQSEQTIALAALTERIVLDVQSSVRGYLLTGDERLLGPWRTAQTALPRTVDQLVALTAGEPEQSVRARQIHTDALAYLREFANPVVARARTEGRDAGSTLRESLQSGGQRVAELRADLAQLTRTEAADLAAQRADVDSSADRAQTLALAGLVGFLLLLGLVAVLITRRVAFPVRDLDRAAQRVRQGDLDVELPVRSRTEVGRLTESFNAMTLALRESRDELESQNAELEMQTVQLEERQEELAVAGDELRAQRDELEATAALLASEKQGAELFAEFGERLGAETDVYGLAAIVLDTLTQLTGADVGALYGARRESVDYWASLAVRGLAEGAVPERVAPGGEGVAARAVAEGGPVAVEDSSLRVRTLGGEAPVRRELHVPLLHGSRAAGVVTLGWIGEGGGSVDLAVVRRLAGQAAVALAELASVAQVRWLVDVNRVVLDSVREGIALFGRNGRVILANKAIERIALETIGTDAGGTIARGPAAIAALTRDPEACVAAWERVLSDPPEPTYDEFEIAATGRVLAMFSAPVDAPPGRRVGRVLVFRDITDERQAERLKSDLMSTVSHELRTPLASVLGYAELLRTREMEPAARNRILGVVHREAQRLSALIDDFLDLQRMEDDRLRLERRPFRVDELLDEQVRTFAGQSETHRLELSVEDGPPLLASGDRRRIAQVVANLLSNAIKYSPRGGLVRVEGVRRNGEVLVAVSDEGLGIPSDQQPQVFEKFFRVGRPEVSEIGGTGLGLALAHEIVVAHEGEIGFESVEGEGSRFWFTLPGV